MRLIRLTPDCRRQKAHKKPRLLSEQEAGESYVSAKNYNEAIKGEMTSIIPMKTIGINFQFL